MLKIAKIPCVKCGDRLRYIYAWLNLPEKYRCGCMQRTPSVGLPTNMLCFNYLISGKTYIFVWGLLKLELSAIISKGLYSRFNNQLCLIHTYTLDAISKLKNYGMTEATDSS